MGAVGFPERFVLVLAALLAWQGCDRGLGRPAAPRWCTPVCDNRECGEDGCGGTCGECDDGESCSTFTGECLAGGIDTVFGHLRLEVRLGGVEDGEVFLDPPRPFPAFGANATVVDGDGAVIGARQLVSRDGGFEIPVTQKLDGDERLVLATMWAPQGGILMAVLRPEYLPNADHWNEYDTYLWTWDIPIEPGRTLDATLTEAQGSGALYLYLLAQTAMEPVLAEMADGDPAQVGRLGLVWAPGITTFQCLACYVDDLRPHRIEGIDREAELARSIFISGAPGGSSAWGWPVVFHEMGHYVAFTQSRDNSYGGPHYLGQLLAPPFAWSEGWASFFGAMTATRWFGDPTSVYWDVQYGTAFWVDLEERVRDGGTGIGMPRDSKGINQALDEFFVSSALWHLWDGRDGLEDGSGTLSGAELLAAFGSDRFLRFDRGATGSDLVDFLDAAACLYPSDKTWKAQVSADARDVAGFPYDGKPTCGLYPSSAPMAPLRLALEGTPARDGALDLRAEIRVPALPGGPLRLRLDLPEGARVVRGNVPSRIDPIELVDGSRTLSFRLAGTDGRPVRLVADLRGRGTGARAVAQWPEPPPVAAVAPIARELDVPFRLGPVTVTRSIAVVPD